MTKVVEKLQKSQGLKKGLWFIGLWLAGVLVLSIIGGVIRLFLS